MTDVLKVALVGSAPASVRAAPYQDPSWQIWGCSPGVYGVAPRVNEWFETHLWEPGQTWFSPEYVQWLSALPKRGVKLWVGGETGVEGAEIYPFDEVLEEFDPHHWFCTSSLFWMMARAIKQGARTIGLWGVDMAAAEEYEMQRAGIHHLTYIALARGIEVGIPPESDLFTPRFRYGADEWTHSFRKVRARQAELNGRLKEAEAAAATYSSAVHFLKGAIDDSKYMGDTWLDKGDRTGPAKFPKSAPVVTNFDFVAGSIAYVDALPPGGANVIHGNVILGDIDEPPKRKPKK